MKNKNFLSRTIIVLSLAVCMIFSGMTVFAAPTDAYTAESSAYEIVNVTEDDYDDDYYDDDYYDDDYYEDDYYDSKAESSSKEKKQKNWLKIILIAVGIGLVVSVITVLVIRSGYKNNGKTEPYEFKNKAPLDLTDSRDELVDVKVTSERIHRD